ncbi:MAG TPA: hypothetical protein VIV40_30845 [Kofleriaceae bacterium]
MTRVFANRHDAGAQLARALHGFSEACDAVVVALTRDSVPVAYEVATRLALPLTMVDDDDLNPTGKTVIVVDDGDAAREMCVDIERLRSHRAAKVVAAVPVASPQVFAMLHAAADYVACVLSPQHIYSVQAWYADFEPPSDDDVRHLRVAAAQNLVVVRRTHFLTSSVDS